ncbi:metallophosphoesterase family protein [Horticoccus luteus]|uniref:Metallophosphoesterase family protein n=1 Tax=Horticoccus luteus TaxID=2862869 RepID=A0A8F9TVM5_9BACT|nr:metallophosphoesterase [Horticoccus luteus]QYM79951.1 metallophosphoesterase family protein [Horticoccus luteus]
MAQVTRIISDLHYGDRASRVASLAMLRPLFEDVDRLVLNGDSLDTRASATPERTATLAAEIRAFFPAHVPAVDMVTGNHDPDFSTVHSVDLGDGAVFATHGDILWDEIVPWGRDAKLAARLLAEQYGKIEAGERASLEERLAALRVAAAAIPQRHQSERRSIRYFQHLVRDTAWPPTRVLRVLRAWQEVPRRAELFVRRYRPNTQCIVIGHTHRPGVWTRTNGVMIINTGSFCLGSRTWAVDLGTDEIAWRRIERRRGEFHVGPVQQRFSLARH